MWIFGLILLRHIDTLETTSIFLLAPAGQLMKLLCLKQHLFQVFEQGVLRVKPHILISDKLRFSFDLPTCLGIIYCL